LFNIYGEGSFFLKKEGPLSIPHPKEKRIGVFFIFHLHKPNKNPPTTKVFEGDSKGELFTKSSPLAHSIPYDTDRAWRSRYNRSRSPTVRVGARARDAPR
jgi:hypothetical protein